MCSFYFRHSGTQQLAIIATLPTDKLSMKYSMM